MSKLPRMGSAATWDSRISRDRTFASRRSLATWISVFMLWGLVVAVLAARAHADLPQPVAHWTFDEAGAEGRDSAGSHHGTVQGAVPHAGKLGKGLLFDRGRKDHVSVPHAADLELSTYTVSAWVWLTKPPTYSGIVGTRQGGAMLFDVKVNADKVHGDIGDGSRWIETKVNFYKSDVGSNGPTGWAARCGAAGLRAAFEER